MSHRVWRVTVAGMARDYLWGWITARCDVALRGTRIILWSPDKRSNLRPGWENSTLAQRDAFVLWWAQLEKKTSISLLKSIKACPKYYMNKSFQTIDNLSHPPVFVFFSNTAKRLLWDFAPAYAKWKSTQCPNASRSAKTLEGLNSTLSPHRLHSPARQSGISLISVSPNVLAFCQVSSKHWQESEAADALISCPGNEFRLQFLYWER